MAEDFAVKSPWHVCTGDGCRFCQIQIEREEDARDFPDDRDAPRSWEP